jgi:hypothetical protein
MAVQRMLTGNLKELHVRAAEFCVSENDVMFLTTSFITQKSSPRHPVFPLAIQDYKEVTAEEHSCYIFIWV